MLESSADTSPLLHIHPSQADLYSASSTQETRPHLLAIDKLQLAKQIQATLPGCKNPEAAAQNAMAAIHRHNTTADNLLEPLSRDVRSVVSQHLNHALPQICSTQASPDGTVKFVFQAQDTAQFEAVFIPDVSSKAQNQTDTLCISSQTGCAVGCRFCFTASIKRHRNLTAAEIIAQVWLARSYLARTLSPSRITNLVFMGMGEPLLNFDNVCHAIQRLRDPFGAGFSRRRITVSTAGIVPKIAELGARTGVVLAVSLNATTDTVRDRLMPINRRWPIATLLAEVARYPRRKGQRTTIEYVLIDGINDSQEDALRLAELLDGMDVKINLLPLNPHPKTPFLPPSSQTTQAFQQLLWDRGYSAIVRQTRGDPISGACGQLGSHTTASS